MHRCTAYKPVYDDHYVNRVQRAREMGLISTFMDIQINNIKCNYTVTCRKLLVTYTTGFGLDDWIYCTLYIHNSGLQVIQLYR
jgi:hypothetical protein